MQLHERLIRPVRADAVLGPTWQQLFAQPAQRRRRPAPPAGGARGARSCWQLAAEHDCAYVYDPAAIAAAAARAAGPEARSIACCTP